VVDPLLSVVQVVREYGDEVRTRALAGVMVAPDGSMSRTRTGGT